MAKYKMVIFDFDGTLSNTFPFVLEVMNKLADAHGFKRVDYNDVDMLRGWHPTEIIKHLGVPIWKIPQVGMHFISLMAENIHRIRLFDGVGDMLKRIKQEGITLAILTSNSYDNVVGVLGPEITALISYFECGAALFGKRPKLKRLCHKSGIKPQDTLYIGDEVRDLEAARAVKMAFGAVNWGYTRPDTLWAHNPDFVFTTIAEVVELLI
ncbi:MAG: HAD hydrolase-like protein [Limnochordia bacterium]